MMLSVCPITQGLLRDDHMWHSLAEKRYRMDNCAGIQPERVRIPLRGAVASLG